MGATVNPYLTKKAMQKKPLALPVAAVCGLFALGAAAMTFDLFSEGQTLYGVMALLSLATLLEPIVHIFIRFRRSLCAQHIAESLLLLTAESLTFDQLQNALFSCKAPQQMEFLISKGYLQNLKIDSAARTVTLYTPKGSFAQRICPCCSGRTVCEGAAVLRCKHCNQPFTER